ncbi:zf-HC2 domain-containing protein [Streptomyces sp. NBC_00335]|uniref:anti-sigma factor family protein n=1 Tax=unclassified Streptomyces TaxID=2593676 RepID=UPI002258D314|nr:MULTISPECIES: zf-HC2 domain-containing protein [unclassified Streptomyces]MCX5405998.1 zf-HC2 domain-containing protein [Streptomyces sp. NBC_00086]
MNPTTGATGTIGHPDVSEISELAEGLLSPSRTAEVRSHLGDCPLCEDVRASLEEIRALLGTLPGPARMPVDVSGRIDAALAAEALLDATTRHEEPGTGHPDPAAPEVPGPDASRETSPGPLGPLGDPGALRPSGHPAGPTGPGRRRARRRIALAGGLLAACAAGVMVFGLTSGDRALSGDARSDASSAQSRSGTPEYTAQGLPGTVRELLASGSRGDKAAGEGNNTFGVENSPQSEPSPAPADGRTPRAPACVQEATGRTESPLGFESGTYEGKDVFLIVLPHPGDPAVVDAYLVGSACVTDPSAVPGKPLLTSTYSRS